MTYLSPNPEGDDWSYHALRLEAATHQASRFMTAGDREGAVTHLHDVQEALADWVAWIVAAEGVERRNEEIRGARAAIEKARG